MTRASQNSRFNGSSVDDLSSRDAMLDDIYDDALALAEKLGADVVINAKNEKQ